MLSLSVLTKTLSGRFLSLLVVVILVTCLTLISHHQLQSSTFFTYQTTRQNQARIRNFVPRLNQPLSMSITRGIVIFYPHNQEAGFLPELRWLYRSWIEMMKYEPSLWRTDLVIYTSNYTSNLQNLGCILGHIRLDRQEGPVCRVFLYERLSSRDITNPNRTYDYYRQIDTDREESLVRFLGTYEYVDSINIMTECYPSFSMYDYILRSDIDVFLTKNFAVFVPENNTFLIGLGGYSHPFNSARLERISKNMQWTYANIDNIGSTWFVYTHIHTHTHTYICIA
jgi:hypothetical protein